MTQQRKQAPSAFATTVLAIPIVNFVGQFFVSSPSFEQVERTLSMLGLVSALVLAVAYSLPGTVSYDELRAADQRFGFSIDDDLSAPNSTTTSHMAAWYHDSAFGGSKPPSFNYGYFLAIACYTLTVVSARGGHDPGLDLCWGRDLYWGCMWRQPRNQQAATKPPWHTHAHHLCTPLRTADQTLWAASTLLPSSSPTHVCRRSLRLSCSTYSLSWHVAWQRVSSPVRSPAGPTH